MLPGFTPGIKPLHLSLCLFRLSFSMVSCFVSMIAKEMFSSGKSNCEHLLMNNWAMICPSLAIFSLYRKGNCSTSVVLEILSVRFRKIEFCTRLWKYFFSASFEREREREKSQERVFCPLFLFSQMRSNWCSPKHGRLMRSGAELSSSIRRTDWEYRQRRLFKQPLMMFSFLGGRIKKERADKSPVLSFFCLFPLFSRLHFLTGLPRQP